MAVRIESRAEPIPGYRLIERLGGGGFGEVWKAEAPGGLHKAIKFVFGDLKGAGDDHVRAEQELKSLSRVKTVRHPFILSLERYDIIDGQLMIVMELADRNLWDRYKECRAQGLEGIPRLELLQYMMETAEALDLMNSEFQLQHLDIKPQNIFLVHNHVKVADFGLAKDFAGTQTEVTGGVTPVYAAPETFHGYISRFSDQYSLAIVYQELLTGRRPFNGTTVNQLILQHLQSEPNLTPLPPRDREMIARGLAKAPDHRYPNCLTMIRLLAQNTGDGEQSKEEIPNPRERGESQTPGSGASPKPQIPAEEVRVDLGSSPGMSGHSHTGVSSGSFPGAGSASGSTNNLRVDRITESQGATKFIRTGEAATRTPATATATAGATAGRKEMPELKGDGILFPALLVGLGQTGMHLLHRLREVLVERFDSLSLLPHVRMRLLDTDPEIARQAMAGKVGSVAFTSGEILVAGLNRPSYYLKPRDGKPSLDSWLNQRMLYRIPRSQQTTGVRALGRLAYCDNFRLIQRHLQADLEACLDPVALNTAARQWQLGLRTSRPRVYILCGLAGGTGGGMFLDLAYTLRSMLRNRGFDQPDIVGLFLLPPLDGTRTQMVALGNMVAALNELNYFGSPGSRFFAQYGDRDLLVESTDPPFSRYFLLPMPEEADEVACREVFDLAAQFLYRDLFTGLGKTADLARAGLPSTPWQERGQFYSTFGLYQLTWPRRALVRKTARAICLQLLNRWLCRDSKSQRESIQVWLQEQWADKGLGAERFISRLRDACQEVLQKPPETIFYALIEPLTRQLPVSPARRGAHELPIQEVAAILAQLEEYLGSPSEEQFGETEASLIRQLRQLAEETLNHWDQTLTEIAVQLIEEPAYRLSGAEEVIRQMVATIEQILQHQEPLLQELTTKARDAHASLRALCAGPQPGQRRPPVPGRDVVELLRFFAKTGFQSQLLTQVVSSFVTLRGHLSDQLREVNSCRTRLAELQRQIERGKSDREHPSSNLGRHLFPGGLSTLDEATQQFLAGVTPEILLELDTRMEEMIRKRFTALVNICLSPANILRNVELAMLETAEQFCNEKLPTATAAQLFLEHQPERERATDEIGGFYDEAKPDLMPPRSTRSDSVTILLAPPDEAGEAFRNLAHAAMPEVEIHTATSTEDILFYRESANLRLGDLPHLGGSGLMAYQQMNRTDHFTPHTRTDIDFKRKES